MEVLVVDFCLYASPQPSRSFHLISLFGCCFTVSHTLSSHSYKVFALAQFQTKSCQAASEPVTCIDLQNSSCRLISHSPLMFCILSQLKICFTWNLLHWSLSGSVLTTGVTYLLCLLSDLCACSVFTHNFINQELLLFNRAVIE